MNIPHTTTRALQLIITGSLLLLALLLSGCQEVFTYSLFEGLQRDPSSLPPEQQISFARSALASGDPDAMADIYDEIVDLAADDPELYLLAADLAMGASGITNVVDDVLSADDPSTLDFNTVLASVDLVMLANVADNVLAAEAAGVGGVTEEQYVAAAGAELLQYVEDPANDLANIDWSVDPPTESGGPAPQEILNAYSFLQSTGQDPAEFDDIFGG